MKPLTADAHSDPLWLLSGYAKQQAPPTVNAVRMKFGGLDRVTLALYLSDPTVERIGPIKAWEAILHQAHIAEQSYKGQFLALEGGSVLGYDPVTVIARVQEMAKLGIKYLTLVHNTNNQMAGSATDSVPLGLSRLGFEVMEECEDQGILVDVSHASDRTLAEILPYSKRPIIASHSGCRAVTNQTRNLTDQQTPHNSMTKGMVCVPFARKFVHSIDGVGAHIDHVCQVTGSVDYVGVGSDLDGAVMVAGVTGSEDWSKVVIDSLVRRGFNDEAIRAIAGGNLLKLFGEA